MPRIFAAVMLGVLLNLGLPAGANEADWPALEARLRQVVSTPEFVEAVLDKYKLKGSTRAAMRTHLVELYRSQEVIKALVSEMRNLGIDSHAELYADQPIKFGQKFGAELMQSWAIKGLARLPSADQRSFYRYVLRWMAVASPEDCKQMMYVEDKSAIEGGRLEMKYFARMSQPELEAYLALMRKAIFAELREFPSSRTLNGEQLQIAEKAFQANFEETIRVERVSADVLVAMANAERASPEAACEAGKLIFRTLLNMKGLSGDWMVLKMVLSSQ